MFCSNCGEKLEEGAKFCPKCGATQGAVQPKVAPIQPVAVQPQPVYQQPVSAVPSNQQQVVTRSKTSKSGVTALVLSLVTFLVELIAVSYMLGDGWFGYWGYDGNRVFMTDWVIGYIPLYLLCLVTTFFGIISIYGKRTKHGLVGMIVAIADITLLFAGHLISIL